MKVRAALAFKKIPHQRIDIDPAHREEVVKLSGQPLTPILKHGDAVVYDSYGIMRYLDANWRQGPALYSADRATMKSIESWELFARTDAGPAISTMFGQIREAQPDLGKIRSANEIMNRAAAKVEETLGGSEWLVGNAPTAADFTVAMSLYYGAVAAVGPEATPVAGLFGKHLKIENAPKTVGWIRRVMEWHR
jgi:glutathione S-transferase